MLKRLQMIAGRALRIQLYRSEQRHQRRRYEIKTTVNGKVQQAVY